MTAQFSEQEVETPEEETSAKDPIRTLFGPPPLTDGETEDAYAAFQAQVRAALGPIDAIEEIFIRQFVADEWEVQRLRRLKGRFLQFIIRVTGSNRCSRRFMILRSFNHSSTTGRGATQTRQRG